MTQRVVVAEKILKANDELAAENRARLEDAGVFSLNLMASPGAGKTSLVERTVAGLADRLQVAVIDGDLATSLDADRAAAAGARAVQINTNGQCHLDANMVGHGLDALDLSGVDLLIIENVGNLVCPVEFALGAHRNVLIASVPEGDDKPYKYPGSYRGMDVVVLNKIDLLPHVRFDVDRFRHGVEVLNPGVRILEVSCTTGEGLPAWLAWISEQAEAHRVSSDERRARR
ncbi:MAG TPA: hydrogenase nickel incorporation protein HypB [Anaerolineales bacterium]|nr:hydrogenase nickel incorporation protein HypB [Anaerolineales bacterium]